MSDFEDDLRIFLCCMVIAAKSGLDDDAIIAAPYGLASTQ